MDKDEIRKQMVQTEVKLAELEDDNSRQRRKFDEQEEEYAARQSYFHQILYMEREQRYTILNRFEVPYDEMQGHFRDLNILERESEEVCNKCACELEENRDKYHKDYRRKYDKLEEELEKWRRLYGSTDE